MPEITHGHIWTQTRVGVACELGNCTAQVTQAEISANIPTGMNKHVTFNDLLNQTYKKAGH